MVTIEQIAQHDQTAAAHIADLREKAAAGYSHRAAKPGHRGLVVGRLKELGDDTRYEFIECVFGIVGGSSHGLTTAQCNALLWWIDGNDSAISDAILIVAAYREVQNAETEKEKTVNEKTKENDTQEGHWLTNEIHGKFVKYVEETGLSKKQVFKLFKAATATEALDLQPQAATHGEALAVAWADVYAPDGTRVALTARQGATGDDVAATALAWVDAWQTLRGIGWTQAPNGRMRQPAPPAPQKPVPAPAQKPELPSIPATVPEQDSGEGVVIETETILITAPKGKPVMEFWRSGRKYAEIRFHLGGEAFLKLAPKLAEAGWTAEHFDTVGQEHQLPLNITWRPSKDGKYKDIVSAEPR